LEGEHQVTTEEKMAQLFSARARELHAPVYGAAGQERHDSISLAFGLADPALFPREELLAATAAVLADDASAALNYGMSYRGFDEQIAERLRREGVDADADNVLVTHGSGQVLSLLPDVFVDPGDTVIVEGPTFMGAVKKFALAGANLVAIPIDRDGMDIDSLEEQLRDMAAQGRRPKFIYVIPTFQNPTGTVLSLERRKKLVALAAEYEVPVIEDDAYIDLRFRGERLPSLLSLDTAGWVMRLGTYSKILAPGLRIGYAYGRPEFKQRLEMFKSEGTTGPYITRVVAKFAENGRLDRHIDALNDLYRHKADVMAQAIEQHFPREATFLRPDGGFFLWVQLPQGVSAKRLLERAREHGAEFLPGGNCYAGGRAGDDAIRLAFSEQSAEQIQLGIERIGRAFADM
jgi:2-aminoadipate transaminase